jgi:GDP-L-fucose synthase
VILDTVGHGFLGRWIESQLGARPHFSPRSAVHDLRDADATQRYVERHGITTILHAAGDVGGIGLHRDHPGRVALDNLVMGVNVLRAAAMLARPAHVVIVSTVCAYPESAPLPTSETALYDGFPAADTAGYGLAKRELHSLANALAAEYGMTYSYVIPTNLYGPEDHFDEARSHVLPALIRRASQARRAGQSSLVVWGDGTATRDLLYVEDCARGVVLAADVAAACGEVINLGSGREIPIRELAEAVCREVGFDGGIVWDRSKPQGAPRRALDPQKARRLLDFAPRVPFEEGLHHTVDWYRRELND